MMAGHRFARAQQVRLTRLILRIGRSLPPELRMIRVRRQAEARARAGTLESSLRSVYESLVFPTVALCLVSLGSDKNSSMQLSTNPRKLDGLKPSS